MGSFLGSGSTFLIYVLLARELGVDGFGDFGSALSIAQMFCILAGFGISQVWLKFFGVEGWGAFRWISPSIKILLLAYLVSVIFMLLWAFLGPHDKEVTTVLMLFCFFILGQVGVDQIIAKLQLEERYASISFWQIAPNLLRLIVVFSLVYIFNAEVGVKEAVFVYALVGILIACVSIYHMRLMGKGDLKLVGHGCRKDPELGEASIKAVFFESFPFVLATLFSYVYLQIDIVMLKYMVSAEEAGRYNVAYVLLTAVMVFPAVLFGKFFLPKYHRWSSSNRELLKKSYDFSNKIMLVIGMGVAFFIYVSSDLIVKVLFGVDYKTSVIVVDVISLVIPFYFVSYSVGAVLVTQDNMRHKVKAMGGVAFLNVIFNLVFIPLFAAEGAAIATVLSNIILFFLYLRLSNKYVFGSELVNVE